MIDQLRSRTSDPEQLGMAATAAQALGDELTRLAEAAREDANLATVALAPMPISEVLDAILDTWGYIATRKGLQFEVEECALPVHANAATLLGVLNNVVGNAIKYPAQGSVRVRCQPTRTHLHGQVTDTGIGIPANLLGRIFEEFGQADPASTGLGLGLSIAKRGADISGCELTVQSQLGSSSTFGLLVPLADAGPLPPT